MAIILNIETAAEICSVALSNEDGVIDYRENMEGKSHASMLTVFIDDILKSNSIAIKDLSAVAISKGPGSYTGLRIGVSAAKGLCYGAEIPLIGISTLQIMAITFIHEYITKHTVNSTSLLFPMIDARRLEVYTAFFDIHGTIASGISAEIINETTYLQLLNDRVIYFFGNGSDKCKSLITHKNAHFINGIYPSARNMAKISMDLYKNKRFEDTAYFEPFYLKDFVATIPKNKVIHQGKQGV
jgi:tRNA threonylcarbamoyladenosine biosynthesis protein TsaB